MGRVIPSGFVGFRVYYLCLSIDILAVVYISLVLCQIFKSVFSKN